MDLVERIRKSGEMQRQGLTLKKLDEINTDRLLGKNNVSSDDIDTIEDRIVSQEYDSKQLTAVHNALCITGMGVNVVAAWDPKVMTGEQMMSEWQQVDEYVRGSNDKARIKSAGIVGIDREPSVHRQGLDISNIVADDGKNHQDTPAD